MEYEEGNLETKWLDTWFISPVSCWEHVNSESSYKSANNLPEIWPPGRRGVCMGGPRLDSEYDSRWTICVAFFVLSYVLKWTIMSLHSGQGHMIYELWIMIMTKRCKRCVTLDAWRGDFTSIFDAREKQNCIIITRINKQCMLHVASRLWGLRGPSVLPTALAKRTHAGFVASWIMRITRYHFYQRS